MRVFKNLFGKSDKIAASEIATDNGKLLTDYVYDTGWVQLKFISPFGNYDNSDSPPMIRRIGNVVTITGQATPTTKIANSNELTPMIDNVPAQFLPTKELVFQRMQGSGTNTWLFRVNPNSKTFYLHRYGNTTYGAVEVGEWLPFCVTYMI